MVLINKLALDDSIKLGRVRAGSAGAVLESHRYWRFEFSTGFSNAFTAVQEIEFYSSLAGEIASTATLTTTSQLQPGFVITNLTNGNLVDEIGGNVVYDNDAVHKFVDLDFGSAVDCHHVGIRDSGVSSSQSLGNSPRLVVIYYSDDNITYTLHFMGFDETEWPAVWHYYDSPEVADISIATSNTHCGLMTREGGLFTGQHEVQELKFLEGVTEKAGAVIIPTTLFQSSRSNAGVDVANAFLNDTSRAVTLLSGNQASSFWGAEMLAESIVDKVEVTAGLLNNAAPKDFSLMVGDGSTYIPVVSTTGQIAWSSGETRTFT